MRRLLTVLFLLSFRPAFAQDSTATTLAEVTVTANFQQTDLRQTGRNVTVITARDIEQAPVKTLDGILQYALNVDVRTRGPLGVQADVSIRGGNFDQTLVLVDGVKFNDPQTGHHTLNLPLPVDLIEKIEVLQGGDSRVFGPSAFSGVINIITKKNLPSQARLGLVGGEHGLAQGQVALSHATRTTHTLVAAEKLRSDGYAPNTGFSRHNLYGRTTLTANQTTLSLQGGWMDNRFGAANFYHPKFYNQYEAVQAQFAVAQVSHTVADRLFSTLTASWRRHFDQYDFDKYRLTKPAAVNYHRTDVWDVEWRNRWLNPLGVTSFGAEWRREGIVSNRLGDSLARRREVPDVPGQFYSLGKDRDNVNFYAEHLARWGGLTVVAGTLVNVNSQFGTDWFPGLDAAYRLSDRLSVYGSLNRSLRYPTFTEMYLNSSTVVADPNLRPEKAWTYELGTKRFTAVAAATVAVFYRQTATAIDKIKRPDQAIPRMENLDNLGTVGVEASYTLRVARLLARDGHWLQRLTVNYAYLRADRKQEGFQSFYTLNYLRHKLSVGANLRLANRLSLDAWYTFKQREGSYQWDAATPPQPYAAIHLVDARLTYALPAGRVFLDGTNLLNQAYYEHGFVAQPGRWLSAGLQVVVK
jgi:iron complex outermembrane receptor protein